MSKLQSGDVKHFITIFDAAWRWNGDFYENLLN